MIPLLLLLGGGAAGLSMMGSAGDKVGDIAGDVVEQSFTVMGTGVVMAGKGFIKSIKKETKGHGIEITASITVIAITYFFFKRYIQ